MKFFKSKDEMTIRDVTEVLYTASQFQTYFVPHFKALLGSNYKSYIMDTLVLSGMVDLRKYIAVKRQGDSYPTFVYGIADELNSLLKKAGNRPFDKNLLTSYISAIILKSNPEAFQQWFEGEATEIGAVHESVAAYPGSEFQRLCYEKYHKNITDKEWTKLSVLCN